MNLYRDFFAPGKKGYHFIRAFHLKNINLFKNSDLEDPDALINQVFIAIHTIRLDRIKGPIENYVSRAIAYQCWRILEREIEHRRHRSPEIVRQGDEPGFTLDAVAVDSAGADDGLYASELLAQLALFRQTLNSADKQIINGLLDGYRPMEIAHKVGLTERRLNVRLLRLRRKLALFLKKLGYAKNILKDSAELTHYKTKKTL